MELESDDTTLLEPQQDVLAKNDPMWSACWGGHLERLQSEAVRVVSTLPRGLPRAYERGGEGETILHIAVLCSHKHLVRWILSRFPDLVNEVYLKDTYCGETALHVAVMKAADNDDEVVRMLLEAGANVNAEPVTGAIFFKDEHNGGLYYGQTILQFAAANKQEAIVKLLLDHGAHMDATDFYGNTILHVLAYLGTFDLQFFLYLKDRNTKDRELGLKNADGNLVADLMKVRNNDGYTPFQVGIARGHRQIIDCIKNTLWTFGDACEFHVQLEDIDNIQPESLTEDLTIEERHVSALEMAVNREHIHIVDHPLFFALVQAKWLHYGRRFFLFRLIASFALIIVFTLAVSMQPPHLSDRTSYATFNDLFRLIAELCSLFGAASFLQFRFNGRQKNIFKSDATAIPYLFAVPILVAALLRITCTLTPLLSLIPAISMAVVHSENILLGFAAVLGWLNILYFSDGFQNIGPLVLIFRRVLFYDLREWLLLYAVFTCGFAAAFNLQMKDAHSADAGILDWDSYGGAVLWTVRFVFGDGNYDDFRQSRLPVFTVALFFLYGFLVLVLLVNIFIAKLSLTFTAVAEDSARLWKLQFASLMLDIDSRLSPEMKQKIASQFGWRDSPFENKRPDPRDRRFVFTERLQPTTDGEEPPLPTTLKIKIGKRGSEAMEMVPNSHTWSGFLADIIWRWPSTPKAFLPYELHESWLNLDVKVNADDIARGKDEEVVVEQARTKREKQKALERERGKLMREQFCKTEGIKKRESGISISSIGE